MRAKHNSKLSRLVLAAASVKQARIECAGLFVKMQHQKDERKPGLHDFRF